VCLNSFDFLAVALVITGNCKFTITPAGMDKQEYESNQYESWYIVPGATLVVESTSDEDLLIFFTSPMR